MALSSEENRLLTQVGPNAPMGRLLRQYWHPVATIDDVPPQKVKTIRLLGEDFVLFRTADGELTAVEARCPHRGASLSFGFVDDGCLRCSYHGWAFDPTGQCVETPNEPENSRLASLVKLGAFPVVEKAGLIFLHLGGGDPQQGLLGMSPLNSEGEVRIHYDVINCNWLQIAENGLDPAHLEWLHGHFPNALASAAGEPEPFDVHAHGELAFERTPYGVVKRRTLEGEERGDADEDWTVGQQVVFPGILYHANSQSRGLQFRTPIDDQHTLHFWWSVREDEKPAVVIEPSTMRDQNGNLNLRTLDGQDVAIWESQGAILDRTNERLGAMDQGISILRHMLLTEMRAVADGETPINSECDGIELPRRTRTSPVLVPRN